MDTIVAESKEKEEAGLGTRVPGSSADVPVQAVPRWRPKVATGPWRRSENMGVSITETEASEGQEGEPTLLKTRAVCIHVPLLNCYEDSEQLLARHVNHSKKRGPVEFVEKRTISDRIKKRHPEFNMVYKRVATYLRKHFYYKAVWNNKVKGYWLGTDGGLLAPCKEEHQRAAPVNPTALLSPRHGRAVTGALNMGLPVESQSDTPETVALEKDAPQVKPKRKRQRVASALSTRADQR